MSEHRMPVNIPSSASGSAVRAAGSYTYAGGRCSADTNDDAVEMAPAAAEHQQEDPDGGLETINA